MFVKVLLSLSLLVGFSSSCIYPNLRTRSGRQLAADFDYSDGPNGPEHWPELFASCGGNQQSPIDVPSSDLFREHVTGVVPTFHFAYNSTGDSERNAVAVLFANKGKTVEVKYHGQGLELTGAETLSYLVERSDDFIHNVYSLEQFHFHWGMENDKGMRNALLFTCL